MDQKTVVRFLNVAWGNLHSQSRCMPDFHWLYLLFVYTPGCPSHPTWITMAWCMLPVWVMFCLTHLLLHLVSAWEPWSLSAPSRSSQGQSPCKRTWLFFIRRWNAWYKCDCVTSVPYRNITDVLSCFSDSPPPSPTFPEGGSPVLYGEEDNKVTRTNYCLSQARH